MFVEMLPEDEKYMQDILSTFQIKKYKLSETPTRFKLILDPDEFTLKTLDNVQSIRDPVGIEIDVQHGVYLECLKSGCSRKKRRLTVDIFSGTLPPEYESGKFNKAMRHILGIEDICTFKRTLNEDTLVIKDIECLSYPLLKRIEKLGYSIAFNMRDATVTLTI